MRRHTVAAAVALAFSLSGCGGDGDTSTLSLSITDAPVDEATKVELLRRAVANVFPSPKEGWGITVMEAAACGTPSLASDSPGLRDSVRDGHTGLLVPHGNPEALAAAMLRLAADRELVVRLGVAARAHALTHGWDAAADRVEAHLRDLAAGLFPPPSFTS